MARRYLVLHGWENRRPPAHWQYWLTERLRAAGEQVLYPQLPDPDEPKLADWLDVLRAELAMLGTGERIVIAHSLGCLLWLHHAATADHAQRVDRLLLVCPPGPSECTGPIAHFAPPPLDPIDIRRTTRRQGELACTDTDPWCPEGARRAYGEPLDLATHVVPDAGHLAADDGYGPWPAVEQWALSGAFPSPEAGRAGWRP